MNKIVVPCSYKQIDNLEQRKKIIVNQNRIENIVFEIKRNEKIDETQKQILQILLKYLKKDKIINGYYVQMKASEVRFCFKGRRVRGETEGQDEEEKKNNFNNMYLIERKR